MMIAIYKKYSTWSTMEIFLIIIQTNHNDDGIKMLIDQSSLFEEQIERE
jgi:hypothetical protein